MNRIRDWLGWLLVPTVLVMEVFDLRSGVNGRPSLISAFLVGFALLALVCLPWSVAAWRRMSREVRWMALGFLALMAYAMCTASTMTPPIIQRTRMTRGVLVVPVVTAVVTMLAAFGMAAVVRRIQLWVTCWVVLVASVATWPRAVRVHESVRISTGMGGAAVYHVVLLTCLAFFLGCALQGWRRIPSVVGAVASAALVVAVGSRAGFMCMMAFGCLAAAWGLQQGFGRWVGRLTVVSVGVLAVLIATVPSLQRLLLFSEPRRQANLVVALRVWRESLRSVVLGVGSGHLWPWYSLDIKMIPAPGSMMVVTAYGKTLNSPHSTLLAVLVELGLVGFVVLLAVLGLLVWRMLRLWTGKDRIGHAVSMALVASLLAFFFDTYLLKNFGVSFWWWLMLFAAVGAAGPRGTDAVITSDES